jgi:lipopolysaccharide transport system permease protein
VDEHINSYFYFNEAAGSEFRFECMLKKTVLQAGAPSQYWQRLREVFHYRDLLWMLSYRDIRVRYAQTWLGLTWSLINPLISMFLLYVVFGVVVKADTEGIPSILFIISGLLSWNYFANVAGEAGRSIIGAQSIVKKVYFPRLIIPLSKTVSALFDLVIVFVILIILLIWYKVPILSQAIMMIPLIILTIFAGLAVGIWIAALSIRYRDFNHIVPLMLRIGMFLSPIAYMTSNVPERYKWLFWLNPLTGIMDGMRWSLFDTAFNPVSLIASICITIVLLVSGIWYFLRMDQYIDDII